MIFGYLDPGSGSLILQTLLGGIAGGVVAVKALRHKLPFMRKRSEDGATAPTEPAELAEPADSPVTTET
jgi:hypothetical protein